MSSQSICYEGKVLHYKYATLMKDVVAFYLCGDSETHIGNIWKCKHGYSAVSYREERTKHIYPVDGFKTRQQATSFLLKDSKFYPRRDNHA